MADVEYVARVVVERVVRRVVPKGTPTGRRSITTSEDRIQRDKVEVLSFTVRAVRSHLIQTSVRDMMSAGLAGVRAVEGEPVVQDDEEEEDEL